MDPTTVSNAQVATDCIETALRLFLGNADDIEMTLPNALNTFERDFILNRISKLNGITWEITRRRQHEFLTLRKAPTTNVKFSMGNTSRQSLASLMVSKDRPTSKPKVPVAGNTGNYASKHFQFQPRYQDRDYEKENIAGSGNRIQIIYPPLIPPRRQSDEFAKQRESLPIWKYKDAIMESIQKYPVTVIVGKSGSGKSTQVPQFIMDAAAPQRIPTKILSCHPHRVSAVIASSCVARERGERIGIAVGFQARLESCYSPCSTILLYSTSELFLRSLVPPTYPVLNNATHVILDDFEVRNAESDFALACILNLQPIFRYCVIIQSAEIDIDELMNNIRQSGFPNPHLIRIEDDPPNSIPVVLHLEDIETMLAKQLRGEGINASRSFGSSEFQSPLDSDERCKCCDMPRSGHLVNHLMHRYLFLEDNEAADEFLDLVLRQEVDVNGRHKATGLDFSIAAAMKGQTRFLGRLCGLGANISRSLKHSGEALANLLTEFRQPEVSNYINSCQSKPPPPPCVTGISPVNLRLILELIQYIHNCFPLHETILVFLSSYDEIITLKEMLFNKNLSKLTPESFFLCILHVNIPSGDEKIIFDLAPDLVRKIILTTDIGDSLSVKEVRLVIDSGYTEQRSYNAKENATGNKKVLISKAAARERIGEHTFRLYDRETFKQMAPFRTPEILQSRLQELCLYSASLIKNSKTMVKFFEQFLSPPSTHSLNRSFEELISIGALDKSRKVTALGSYLLDFPVEPRFAKALIYGSILRCLDPVLTIVAVLSHRDPFKTPVDADDQVRTRQRRGQLSKQTFSDHMAILQAFLEWENDAGWTGDTSSMHINNISPGTFDMICDIRTDLLGQLRAFGFVRCKGIGNIKDLNTNSHNWSVVKAALVAALYPNVMRVNQRTWSLSNSEFEAARLHPLSCMTRDPLHPSQLPAVWALYDEVNQSAEMDFCKGCTLVSTFVLMVFSGSPYNTPELEELGTGFPGRVGKVKLHDGIVIEGPKTDMEMALTIRKKFQALVERQIRKPGTMMMQSDERDLQMICLVLTTEDRSAGLSQIDGIGQWPRFAGGSLLSVPCQGFTKSAEGPSAYRETDD